MNAVPIKKRRFPVIPPPSPPRENKEECQCKSDTNIDNKPEPSNFSDVTKTRAFVVEKEEFTPVTNIKTSLLENLEPQEPKPSLSLGPKDEFMNKVDVSLNGKLPESSLNVEPFASKSMEPKPNFGLGPKVEFKNKEDLLLNGKLPESSLNVEPLASMSMEPKPSLGLGPKVEFKNKGDLLLNGKLPESSLNVEPFASKFMEPKPSLSLGPKDEFKYKVDVSLNGKLPESSNVKQEIPSAMNVELSIGPKKPLVRALEQPNSLLIAEKSDHSLLSLSLGKEKAVLYDNAVNSDVSSGACSDRSNWDLNTTMDAWESPTASDAFTHGIDDIGGFSKTDTIDNVKSSMTTAGTVDLYSNKGKSILNEPRAVSSNTSEEQFQRNYSDDSVHLRLAMPFRESDFGQESSALLNKFTSAGPSLSLQQVHLSATNLNNNSGRTVKSEPVDENANRDSSIGSSSSSTMGLKFSSVKRELGVDHGREMLLPSSVSPDKIFDHRSVKPELVLPKSVGIKTMQHQESCASSSALSASLMPQNLCGAKLETCSEFTFSGDLSSQSERSSHSKEVHNHNDTPMVSRPVTLDGESLKLCNVGNSNVKDPEKCVTGRVPEHGNRENKLSIPAEIVGNDFGSRKNGAVDTRMNLRQKISHKEDEYEDGEIREPLRPSSGKVPNVEGKKTETVDRKCESSNSHPCVNSEQQDANASEFGVKAQVRQNHDETHSDRVEESVMIGYEPRHSENNPLQRLSEVSEAVVNEKRCISVVTPEKQLDQSGIEDVEEGPGEEVSSDRPTNGGDEATDKVVKEVYREKDDSALNCVETSVNGSNAAAKDPNNVGNKSRIINLNRGSVACKTKPVPSRLLTSRTGKERSTGPDGEIQPQGYRDEIHTGGFNKYVKDRDQDHSFKNPRLNFSRGRGRGRGRGSGQFGTSRREWDSNHDFASENYNGPSDYRAVRHKHASSSSDVDRESNGYDDTSFVNNRRKPIMNDEFPMSRRTSYRRLSPGDREGSMNRGNQMLRRMPRNISPSQYDVEDNKFMRHVSDDMIDPVYTRSQVIYEEVDEGGQPVVRGNRNISTMQRKGYPRIRSKSPIRRRSPNGLLELNHNRSPAMYRTGRMRSPNDRVPFREEITVRRRGGGSPSFVSRHPNELRNAESHHRSANSSRRSFSPPPRVFQRSSRRADALDLREIGDGDEYIDNGPPHATKFRGDGIIDDKRKFVERQRPVRSFRQSYNGDGDNFHFHSDDGGPRPYRFCPDTDTEFVERNNVREREFEVREREFDGREREFEGRIKHHQPLVVSRRIRNIDEQQDVDVIYRPGGRVWHDDGFSDVSRGKRRRF